MNFKENDLKKKKSNHTPRGVNKTRMRIILAAISVALQGSNRAAAAPRTLLRLGRGLAAHPLRGKVAS